MNIFFRNKSQNSWTIFRSGDVLWSCKQLACQITKNIQNKSSYFPELHRTVLRYNMMFLVEIPIFKCFLLKSMNFEYEQRISNNIVNDFHWVVGLTLSWRRPISYRNQSIDLRSKSNDWFLYDNGLRHERVQDTMKAYFWYHHTLL